MAARVIDFPSRNGRVRVEPIHARWVITGWRQLPDGTEVDADARVHLHVHPDGTWTVSVKPGGKGLWRHLSGDDATSALDYFRAMMGLQFTDRRGDRGEDYVAFGAMVGAVLTLF